VYYVYDFMLIIHKLSIYITMQRHLFLRHQFITQHAVLLLKHVRSI